MIHYFIIPIFKPNIIVLSKLLKSLKRQKFLLINNDIKTPLKIKKENITTINNEKNCGFGGGVNVGMRIAFENGALWITILNQDLSLSKQALTDLNKTLKHMRPSIIGPFGGIFDKKRWTTIVNEKNSSIQNNPEYISGSCLSIHKDVVAKIGYFYEPYFMYYEDADYSVRAHHAGFPIIATPRKGITHYHTAIVGVGSAAHQYYLARNHMLFVERMAPIKVKIYELVRLPKTLYEHYRRKEHGALSALWDYVIRSFGPYSRSI